MVSFSTVLEPVSVFALAMTIGSSLVAAETTACFNTVQEASSIGSLLYANLWRDHQATGCDPAGMGDVYRKYATEDVQYSALGEVTSDGVEEWIINAVDSGILPTLCEHAFFSLAAYDTTIIEDGVSFLFEANVVFVGDGSTDADEAIAASGSLTGHQHTVLLDEDCVATYSAVNMEEEFDI